MEQIARKYSKEMEGLEFLVHIGPPPQCLVDAPEDDDRGSSTSSRLSDPFSEYASLEVAPASAVHGQFSKFSQHFQDTIQEMTSSSATVDVKVKRKENNILSNFGNVVSLVQSQATVSGVELKINVPEALLPPTREIENAGDVDLSSTTRRMSSATPAISIKSDEPEIGHGNLWNMLEKYSDFKLSVCDGPDQKSQTSDKTREDALVKCAAWIERHGGTTLVELEATPPPTPEIKPKERKISKWKREKTLILACRSSID